jgi:DNA-directed RNA polymerase specialized sigma24 family protein
LCTTGGWADSRWYQKRDSDVRAWLLTILHNLAINLFRQAASRGKHGAIETTAENDFGEPAAQGKSRLSRCSEQAREASGRSARRAAACCG